MVTRNGMAVQPAAIDRWTQRSEELHRRIAGRFARSDTRERLQRYLFWGSLNEWSTRMAGGSHRR
jgi:hypothetical protein